MKKNICLITIVAIAFLYGCNERKNFFSKNMKILDDEFKVSSTISGEKLPTTEVYNITSLICFDEYLLVITPGASSVFNVLTFNGKVVSQFGTIGRANDELANGHFNGQTGKIDGDNCIWVSDVGKARLVLIDIDKSMENGKLFIIREIKTTPMCVDCFCINDSVFISEQLMENNYELLKHNMSWGILSRNVLYSDAFEDAFSLYHSIWRWDPHRNRMIGAMLSVNQINFYSLDNQERFSIVIGESRTDKNELIDAETGLALMATFSDLVVTDSYIYALYINQDYDDAYEKAKPLDLLIFDLDGNLDRVIRINEYVFDIAISSNGEYLYGSTSNDEIYRYRL